MHPSGRGVGHGFAGVGGGDVTKGVAENEKAQKREARTYGVVYNRREEESQLGTGTVSVDTTGEDLGKVLVGAAPDI